MTTAGVFTLPTLYKKTNTDAIQYWTIAAYEDPDHSTGWIIETEYGQVGTTSPQRTLDSIFEGKNIGKKNETTPEQQAIAEATSKWQKQKKKGYVESIEAAQAKETDALIEGGIEPMLAHAFSKHGHKIKYPCFAQPKLDGIRCIAIIKDGKCTLWSRTRKKITSMPHIVSSLESIAPDLNMILDGELYSHTYKNNFEHIVSLVRQEEPDPRHTDVEYHVYDIVTDEPFDRRMAKLRHMPKRPYIFRVTTDLVEYEEDVMKLFDVYRNEGYEGVMLRNGDGLYVNKRSYDLQKVKEFDEEEFMIIGAEEGRGKLSGHVGAFICQTKEGKEFLAKMAGDTERLKEYFENPDLYMGKLLTVQYQGLTGKEGVPRFPVGKIIRDYE